MERILTIKYIKETWKDRAIYLKKVCIKTTRLKDKWWTEKYNITYLQVKGLLFLIHKSAHKSLIMNGLIKWAMDGHKNLQVNYQ